MKLKLIKTIAFCLCPLFLMVCCTGNSARNGAALSTEQTASPDTVTIPQDTVAIPQKPYARLEYRFVKPREWVKENKKDSSRINIVSAINRTDAVHLARIDSILIPTDFSFDLASYLPFPLQLPELKEVNKIALFSYPAQIFAAYANGKLVLTGPVNMGRKSKPTPTGLYFTNWKAKHTISTVNDEWDLYWNFNIANRDGIGWHQYALPGYPASHSCLRLREEDARFLYSWADQWKLIDDQTLQLKGTPVIVFGKYNFDDEKPWLALANDPQTLEITASELQEIVSPFLKEILQAQEKRNSVQGGSFPNSTK